MSEISYEELAEGLKLSKFRLVDLRQKDEIKVTGKIPGAHCVPIQELPEALSLPQKDFEAKYGFRLPPSKTDTGNTVYYCRSGRRVGIAKETLQSNGYTGHRLYFGSFNEWQSKGGEVEQLS